MCVQQRSDNASLLWLYYAARSGPCSPIFAERDQKATLDWIWLQQALELNKDAMSTVQPSGKVSLWSLFANDINEVH